VSASQTLPRRHRNYGSWSAACSGRWLGELKRRRHYRRRLETWLLGDPWRLPANRAYQAWREQMQEQEHKKTRALMRSPYEENGSKFSTTARTLANKQAFLAQEYEDPEDRMLDEGKDGSK
jgi:hypothetical protein